MAEQNAGDLEVEVTAIVEKTQTPHATYMNATAMERRILNRAFFKHISCARTPKFSPTR